jgi:hypothetical protein
MTRTGATVWTILGIVAAILLMLGLIYGPELYRKGESIVAPIMELTRSEKMIAELNAELPFTAPEDGLASEDRLLIFFDVRRQLIPHYEAYKAVEQQIERRQQEDLETVGQVLGTVTDVFDAQINTLRERGMSPAEFRWYELEVYDGWLDRVEQAERSSGALAYASELREMTSADLAFVDRLRSRHGSSAALTAVRERLTARLEMVNQPSAPAIDGVAPENNALYWQHRETIAELTLDQHGEMHSRLRQGSSKDGVTININ